MASILSLPEVDSEDGASLAVKARVSGRYERESKPIRGSRPQGNETRKTGVDYLLPITDNKQ